jgi:uncharacterized protein (DUF4415 family)
MKKNANNIVNRTVDLNNLPPFTEEQLEELAAIAAMPDEAIDYSDAPELTDAFWQRVNQPIAEHKTQITLRIDSDVVDFFKHAGKRYQTRINAVLRAYVEANRQAHGH